MSYDYFNTIKQLGLIDSNFGLIPIVASICKESSSNKSETTVRKLVQISRQLMTLNETYLAHSNKDVSDITSCKMTRPEKLFFEGEVPANYLGNHFTKEKILKQLESRDFIKKFFPTTQRMCYHIQKKDDKDSQFRVLKKINDYLSSSQFTTKSKIVEITEAFPADEQQKQNISDRMKLTSDLIDVLLKQNLTFTIIKLEPLLQRRASTYENKMNFPLVGVLRIDTEPVQYVLYVLSFYEYTGLQKKIKTVYNEITDYFCSIFNKNSELNSLLSNIRALSTSDVEPICYMKSMVAQPKNVLEYGKKVVCVIQTFGFVRDLRSSSVHTYLPMANLRDYITEIGWEYYFPAIGNLSHITLMQKKGNVNSNGEIKR